MGQEPKEQQADKAIHSSDWLGDAVKSLKTPLELRPKLDASVNGWTLTGIGGCFRCGNQGIGFAEATKHDFVGNEGLTSMILIITNNRTTIECEYDLRIWEAFIRDAYAKLPQKKPKKCRKSPNEVAE